TEANARSGLKNGVQAFPDRLAWGFDTRKSPTPQDRSACLRLFETTSRRPVSPRPAPRWIGTAGVGGSGVFVKTDWRQGPSCPAGRGKIAGPGPRNSERRAPAGERLSGRGETGWLARTQGGREPQRGWMPREDSRPTEDNARRPVSPRPAP